MKSDFGIKGIISSYSFTDFIKDAIFPIIVSVGLLILFMNSSIGSYSLVCTVTQVALTIIPAMIALMLTAYVFVMTFLFSKDALSTMTNPEEGEKLLYNINSGFGASLLINISSVVLFFIVYCVAQGNIKIVQADMVNYIVLFLLVFFVMLSIVLQINVIIDLFSCGQVMIGQNFSQKD